MRAVSSELAKFVTTRLWMWLVLTVGVLTGLLVTLIVVNASGSSDVDRHVAEMVTGLSPIAYIVAATVGIVGITGEFRHQTITPTLLAMPRRSAVVLAKIVVYLFFGAFLGVVFVAVLGAISVPVLSGKGMDVSLSDSAVTHSLTGAILVCALFGVFGVGVGTLLRNQVAAVVTTIVYLLVVENILIPIPHVQKAYPYLPGGLARAILDRNLDLPDGVSLMHTGQATALLGLWAVGLAVLGSVITLGRDIT